MLEQWVCRTRYRSLVSGSLPVVVEGGLRGPRTSPRFRCRRVKRAKLIQYSQNPHGEQWLWSKSKEERIEIFFIKSMY